MRVTMVTHTQNILHTLAYLDMLVSKLSCNVRILLSGGANEVTNFFGDNADL